MIKMTLDVLAKRLNKTISAMARDTGLNRNTITALFHGNVDGIKFETINRICETYKVSPAEILGYSCLDTGVATEHLVKSTLIDDIYKQEAEAIPFTCWPWMLTAVNKKNRFFDKTYERLFCFYKNGYGEVYWDKKALNELAGHAYGRYSDLEKMHDLYDEYEKYADRLENIYRTTTKDDIKVLDDDEIVEFAENIWGVFENFWFPSIFIDSFDPGFDRKKINEIVEKYSFTVDDESILTSPLDLVFDNERLLALFEIAKRAKKSNITTKVQLKKYLLDSQTLNNYIVDFDYHKSNYLQVNHISRDEVLKDIAKYVKYEDQYEEEYVKLKNYSKNQKAKIRKILAKHSLKENPLEFFQHLTYWREHRKKVNLMGIHVLDLILIEIEERTGIARKYLNYLSMDDIKLVFKGSVTQEVLENRFDGGMLISIDGNGYNILTGGEAVSLRDDLDDKIGVNGTDNIIYGKVASQGYAKGIARIILGVKDFEKLRPGEILITGMTRPEFVPLMEKAAAIVTNEGGVTCHAAIVSRELNKPCIIGTQRATQVIKDGDLIEVRAHHGTVKILNR